MIKNVLKLIMLLTALAFLIENCTTLQPVKESSVSNNTIRKNIQLREEIKTDAHRFIGAKYKYAGTTPKGFDCSGFTSFVLHKHGIPISRSSAVQAREGRKIPVKEVLPGDLIFFSKTGNGKVSHVALVVSNTHKGLEVVHSTSSRGVINENISQSQYWKPKILFARDVIGK